MAKYQPESAVKAKSKAHPDKVKHTEKKQVKLGKQKAVSKTWKVSDLKAADYNPRYITDNRLQGLANSILTFGDLSGVVYNEKTKQLVTGHQRMKSIEGLKTDIITKPYTDDHGTIAVGNILAHAKRGIINIPLRIVNWSDLKVEQAANIAANAHGGEFDKEKLRTVLAELDSNTFDIELIGLNPETIKAMQMLDAKELSKTDRTPVDAGEEDASEPVGEQESIVVNCACTRCGFKFKQKHLL